MYNMVKGQFGSINRRDFNRGDRLNEILIYYVLLRGGKRLSFMKEEDGF